MAETKYVDYWCGTCNLGRDIEIRGINLHIKGMPGPDEASPEERAAMLYDKCCGMPCRTWQERVLGGQLLRVDWNFYRSNGRLPTVADHEAMIRLREANARKNGNQPPDMSDLYDEDGNVWGYDLDGIQDEFADAESSPPQTVEDLPDDHWLKQAKTKIRSSRGNGQRGRPSEIEVLIDEDFVI